MANIPILETSADLASSQSSSASVSVSSALPPVGSIMAYNPGYYATSTNGSFTLAGPGTNTVAGVNAFLPTNWRVCDGTAPNISSSSIWNSNSRYLPNLTDSRFLMGSSTSGAVGGAGSVTLATANLPAHTHDLQNHTHTLGSHTHSGTTSEGSYPAGTNGISINPDNSNDTSWDGYTLNRGGTIVTSTGANGNFPGRRHTHTMTTGGPSTNTSDTPSTNSSGSTGSGTSFSILPTYLSTYYIIRVW